jgi:hypothetical protein
LSIDWSRQIICDLQVANDFYQSDQVLAFADQIGLGNAPASQSGDDNQLLQAIQVSQNV